MPGDSARESALKAPGIPLSENMHQEPRVWGHPTGKSQPYNDVCCGWGSGRAWHHPLRAQQHHGMASLPNPGEPKTGKTRDSKRDWVLGRSTGD